MRDVAQHAGVSVSTVSNVLQILIDGLRDNTDCGTNIIFDNAGNNTDSATLLPYVEQALNDDRDLRQNIRRYCLLILVH
ncbi:LacI family DNA-binding transcriptional regulator [Citrobacter sedlakii]|uniref:LacI family DNA-binding transcriptional regulator n=1 Tax=Citrobacter sedlakii TaxID=67826 RepID=A0ABS0ZWX6_9ENTR|nr:LacI family DNA-binding transcriptional regulator [Citrobacter sedlakii]